ncbi:MAG: GNAT family N-acetyltransferase [Hyphomicrobium sp.]|uniref:GNAT family N-acetyltransferase n=1 Tax=Hyphomicrobium sp. TaxID=82 RepID=UPI003D0F306F
MPRSYPVQPPGFAVVPPGQLVSAVTCVEMRARPALGPPQERAGLSLPRLVTPDLGLYRDLVRAVGEDWLWSSRHEASDEALRALAHDPLVEIYALQDGDERIGLIELDFRQPGECEIVLFGLVEGAIGRGLGRYMMQRLLAIAWSHPIERLWLHTSHLDHPGALAFYQRSGFRPFAFWIEVFDDPRLMGIFPRTAAPHVPLID